MTHNTMTAAVSTFCLTLSHHAENLSTTSEMTNSVQRILKGLAWRNIYLFERKGESYNAKTPLERYAVLIANHILTYPWEACDLKRPRYEHYLALVLDKACLDYLNALPDDAYDGEIQRLWTVVQNYLRSEGIRTPRFE